VDTGLASRLSGKALPPIHPVVAGAGLEPAISAYETERITIFHIPLYIIFSVLGAGIEPALPLGNSILSAACLPIPPPEQIIITIMSKNLFLLFHKDMKNISIYQIFF
jgi:hypothetical protein